jgi:hypothetical protein
MQRIRIERGLEYNISESKWFRCIRIKRERFSQRQADKAKFRVQQEFKHKGLRFQNVTSKEYNRRYIRFVSINLCVKNYNAYEQVGMMKTIFD